LYWTVLANFTITHEIVPPLPTFPERDALFSQQFMWSRANKVKLTR